MKNMYMTPISYKDFDGNKRNAKLHFHLTPREFADWMIDHRDEARQLEKDFNEMQDVVSSNPDVAATEDSKMAMLRLVRVLAELSYGVPESSDVFDKSGGAKFKYSAAYDAFRILLFTNTKELDTFTSTIMNEEVVAEFSKTMGEAQAQPQQDEPAAASPAQAQLPSGKDPKDMTHEELVEAMRQRNQQ